MLRIGPEQPASLVLSAGPVEAKELPGMLRYVVAFCAVCLGGLTAAADLAVSLPLLPPQQRPVAGKRSPE